MKNLLLEKVEYKIETTNFGVWRRFVYPNGSYFAEFKSHATFMGLPLFHYTRGKCPETGRRIIAKGVIAVGRLASWNSRCRPCILWSYCHWSAWTWNSFWPGTGFNWVLCHWATGFGFDVRSGTIRHGANRHWPICLR